MKPVHSTQVLINRWFVKRRGLALGVLSTGVPLGTLILIPLSQFLIDQWGWRETLFFWAGINALILLPLTVLIRNKPGDKGLAPDGIASDRQPMPSLSPQSQNREAVVTVKKESGYSLSEVAKSSGFWLLSCTHLICGVGCGLLMTHTVIFATDLGFSPLIGATFLSVQGGVSIIGVLAAGQLSDRIARKKVLSLVHVIRGASFATLVAAYFMGNGSLFILYTAMVLFGFGWFTTAPLAAGLAADLFGYLRMGTILGIILACHTVGTAIGIYAGGITFQLTGSYLQIFIIAGTLELLAAFFAFIIKTKQ